MAEIDDIKSFANYLPHVLFAIAQILCGTFFIFLIIPSASYLISSNFNFQNLLKMYPEFWDRILSASSFSNLFVWVGLSFSIGICLAEFFYRVGRWTGYINDLGLEDDKRNATEEEQIDLFIWKCHLQRSPWLSRIWEWENFQSNLFFYAEGISFLFVLSLGLSILFTLFQTGDTSGQVRYLVCSLALWITAVFIFIAMRKGRIGKYESFRLAHKAVKKLLNEQKKLETNENVTAPKNDSSSTG
jgi:hypothetical protein